MGRFSFSKAERLSKEKSIKELFEQGSSFYVHPVKVIYRLQPAGSTHHQILISVPVRNFKRAVDRNLIKRRIREAYRTQKELIANPSRHWSLAFVYTAREILPFAIIRNKLFLVLEKIKNLESH